MISHPADPGGAGALATYLATGVSSFVVVDTYVITIPGTPDTVYTVTSETAVVKRGALSQSLGLDPQTLDVTIVVGGAGAALSALKAAALAGSLDGMAFTYSRTYTGGGTALRFTGTVQRTTVTSTEIRIVAITETTKLDAVQLPTHVILPAEFPEIPPPENYNIR